MEFYRSHVLICGGTGCHSSGSGGNGNIQIELAKHNLENEIKLVQTGCLACALLAL